MKEKTFENRKIIKKDRILDKYIPISLMTIFIIITIILIIIFSLSYLQDEMAFEIETPNKINYYLRSENIVANLEIQNNSRVIFSFPTGIIN
jgi:flagellar basal body-associated protein FliL